MKQRAWTLRRGECPICGKPFRDDEEVGPVRTCACGAPPEEVENLPPGSSRPESDGPVRIVRAHARGQGHFGRLLG